MCRLASPIVDLNAARVAAWTPRSGDLGDGVWPRWGRPRRCGRFDLGTAQWLTMRILVTGGAGFIGSVFTRHLLADQFPGLEGAEVTVLDKLTYAGNLANLAEVEDSDRYEFVQGDICDPELTSKLVGHADAVVHFAAESHVDRSILGGADFVLTNVLGTQTLLQAALDTKLTKFVHVSTDEVYGSIDSGSWDEKQPLEPNSPYSASKASSDLIARAYARTHGVPVAITRCSNNYGPYQFPEKVIPLFVTNLMDGATVPLYGEGLQVRDWLHVDDHCRGVALVLAGGRTGEVGYQPQVPFDKGLADTVTWYREHREWWEPLKARSAIDR